MCDYQGYEFGAGSYPDSVCIDGRLLDADNCDADGNLYDNDEDIPCPMCRPDEAVQWWVEQSSGFEDAGDGDALSAARARVDNIRAERGVFEEIKPQAKEIERWPTAMSSPLNTPFEATATSRSGGPMTRATAGR